MGCCTSTSTVAVRANLRALNDLWRCATSATLFLMTQPEAIGQRIKRERLAVNMTQRELASQVNVGVPHISKIEAGRENPSDELLQRVAEVLELDPDELLLVAGRLPAEAIEDLAANPMLALQFLRTFRQYGSVGESRDQPGT